MKKQKNNSVKYVALKSVNYRITYVHVVVNFRNQNPLYVVSKLAINIQMHVYLVV